MEYLDTSVLTGCYCPEARSAHVQCVLSVFKAPSISPLVEVEFHCAVARKVRAGMMGRSEAVKIFSEFQRHLSEPRFRIIQVQPSDYGLARDWIAQLIAPLRVADAIHLAVTFSNGLRLVTADKALAECARDLGVKCMSVC